MARKKQTFTGVKASIEIALMRFRERVDEARKQVEAKDRIFDPKAAAMTGAYDKGKGEGGFLSWNWYKRYGRGRGRTSKAGVVYS